ncbi:hypothetical protein FACS1894181_14910 [Bacteroidia bacterium]|nr:hypothetical protein FACS1894181_14910 [Bacteroidia bacterium]
MSHIPKEIYNILCKLGLENICEGQAIDGEGYVIPKVTVTPVQTGSNEVFFDIEIVPVAVRDNTYVKGYDSAVAQRVLEMNRVKIEHEKEVIDKVKDVVNKYYDTKIKQASPEQKSFMEIAKFQFNNKIKAEYKFSHYDFPKELLEGEKSSLIKEFITINGGNPSGDNPYDKQAYFKRYEPSPLERWSESGNIFAKISYSLSNNAYVLLQVFSCGLMDKVWDRGERINELTGGKARVNLDGSTNYSPVENLVETIAILIPVGSKSLNGEIVPLVTSSKGYLFGSIKIKAPINIPAQRFGYLSGVKPWGLPTGPSKLGGRTIYAIKPEWNPLTQYSRGVIPKGTNIEIGIIGPQYPLYHTGGAIQFMVNSDEVIVISTVIK